VLPGEDLRGGEKSPLTSSVHCRQEGQQGHHRLARAHVPLEQTVHGDGSCHVGEDVLHRFFLAVREGEGEPLFKAFLHKPSRRERGRRGCRFTGKTAAHGQSRLEEEELVEGEAPPGGLPRLPGLGEVKLPDGTGNTGQAKPGTDVVGKVFAEGGKEIIQGGAGHSPKGLLGEARGGRVDGYDGEGLFFVAVLVQDLEVGVRELDRPASHVDPAVEKNPYSRKEHFLKAQPVEPHGPGHGPAVGDEGRDDGKPFPGAFPPLEGRHPRRHGYGLTALKGRKGGEVSSVLVPDGKEEEKIPGGADPEPGKQRFPGGAHPLHEADRVGETAGGSVHLVDSSSSARDSSSPSERAANLERRALNSALNSCFICRRR